MALRMLYLVLVLSLAAAGQERRTLTAGEVIDRIKQQVGVAWRASTVDTIKAGSPATPVTGIAVTMMPTYDVLRRAAASGKNLIIAHEPTFYGHLDETGYLEKENDAVWAAKQAFIKEHNLVIFRFHDHWHARRPDGVMTGVVRALGWQKYQSAGAPGRFTIPRTTLEKLAAELKQKLGSRVVRVVGDPRMVVTRVALNPGAAGFTSHRRLLQREDVEVVVIGEVPEWETIEYVTDAVAQGKRKALILLGHIPSEQAGMEECAAWLKTFIHEAPVEFVPTVEPFWTPE
ncbi:MAG TPA: Nif3-like dinuclear metal center hexameric protein [Bryobacteraceae bacterium]|nr:Nif3-like dinuclear metal center hexameric protein [Bryobacteraceae bacterium]HOQ43800.1 Nif3-like dinuclear metal center hexameric protein [Bryobacteraceae bacterium]HPQ14072.1 Nif3-like dinuclear metal center hexameric protein [Bryobacteraceae bacterium]HPU71757.1 Nif3-like dinuclear metal center hexameric protein [Bryobacteraceae bacterium]